MNNFYVFYGRMNPVHRGHEFIINSMLGNAKTSGAKPIVLLSHGEKPKYKNPLSVERKRYYVESVWPNIDVNTTGTNIPGLMNYLAYLSLFTEGDDTSLRLYCGSDREDEYRELLNLYNGHESSHGKFSFSKIEVWTMGDDRAPYTGDGSASVGMAGVKQISSSAMRKLAVDGNYDNFRKMAPYNMAENIIEEMYEEVRSAYM